MRFEPASLASLTVRFPPPPPPSSRRPPRKYRKLHLGPRIAQPRPPRERIWDIRGGLIVVFAVADDEMGISSMPAPKDSLVLYVLYNAVVSVAALAGVVRAALVFLGLPAPPSLMLMLGEDGEDAAVVSVSVSVSAAGVATVGPSLAETFRARFRPARFGRRRGSAAPADCRVCLVRFEPEAVVNRLPCDHLFHRACLETWLDYDHATCPLCRSRLLPATADSPPATTPRLART